MAMAQRRGATLRPARSAFAAAFLSLLFPGLGHAYIGRWVRAALWAVLPIIGIATFAGLVAGPNRTEVLTRLADPDVLLAALGFIGLDLLYRLLAVIDAWRLGRDRTVGSDLTRSASDTRADIRRAGARGQPPRGRPAHPRGAGHPGHLRRRWRHLAAAGCQRAQPRAARPGRPPGSVECPRRRSPAQRSTDRRAHAGALDRNGAPGHPAAGHRQRAPGPAHLPDRHDDGRQHRPGERRLAFISLPRDTVGVPLPAEWTAARRVYGTRYPGASTRCIRPPGSRKTSSRATTSSAATRPSWAPSPSCTTSISGTTSRST